MSTPWHPPLGEAAADRAPPAPLVGNRPTDVARHVFEDLKAHPGAYFLAGTSYLVVALAAIFVALAALGLGLAPGIAMEDENLTLAGGLVGFLFYFAVIVGIGLIGYPVFTVSLMRNLDRQVRGEATVGFFSLYTDTRSSTGAILFYLLMQVLSVVGMCLLYIPGIIAIAISFFALPIVVFENASPTEALRLGWQHMRSDPGWHVAVWLLMILSALALELTVIGVLLIFPVMVAWQLLAYRAAFGPDGARAWAAARETA